MNLIASLYIPNLAVAVARRDDPALAEKARYPPHF